VHVTSKHKLACEDCDQLFEDKKHLQKHLKMEEVYKNIEEQKVMNSLVWSLKSTGQIKPAL
jgi:uncharacterized C2H2 Zn-finger protein